jgi:hypothetical protein
MICIFFAIPKKIFFEIFKDSTAVVGVSSTTKGEIYSLSGDKSENYNELIIRPDRFSKPVRFPLKLRFNHPKGNKLLVKTPTTAEKLNL